jgi:predicted branched-subunit amino acid permease
MLPGTLAWGIVTGMTMIHAGLSVPQALAMALLVYSGASQLSALPLISAGATVGSVFLVAVLVSLRFVLYTVSLVHDFRRLPAAKRMLLGYFTTDTTVAVYFDLRRKHRWLPQRLAFIQGGIWPVWGTWMIGQIIGIFLARVLHGHEALAYFGVLAMLVMVLPRIIGRPALLCATVATVVALLTWQWPYKLGSLAAVIAGIGAAMLAEHRRS